MLRFLTKSCKQKCFYIYLITTGKNLVRNNNNTDYNRLK